MNSTELAQKLEVSLVSYFNDYLREVSPAEAIAIRVYLQHVASFILDVLGELKEGD